MHRRLKSLGTAHAATFNLTPLIDVAFQLIIFFMLVGGIAGHETQPMELARVQDAALAEIPDHDRLFVNIVTDGSGEGLGVSGVEVGLRRFAAGQVEEITAALEAARLENPRLRVLLRAPAALAYEQVRGVLEAARNAGVEGLALVAASGDGYAR